MDKGETYSWKKVKKARKYLVTLDPNSKEFDEAMDVLSFWRSTHEKPLDIGFKLLQKTVKKIDENAIYAKRLKRYVSIVEKLKRFESMDLKRMYDIWGCRVIVWNLKKLDKVVKLLKKQPYFLDSKWSVRKKDYISLPKEDTWYRSYHLVWNFWEADVSRKIEIQVRTALQHDWATALEIIDLFTEQSLKSNNWEEKWRVFFLHISKLFALIESIHLFNINDNRSRNEFIEWVKNNQGLSESFSMVQQLADKLDIITQFQAFTLSTDLAIKKLKSSDSWYVLIEVDLNKWELKVTLKKDLNRAESDYINAEKKSVWWENLVIALVSTSNLQELESAYPNYFADSKDFIKYLLFIKGIYSLY